MHFRFRHLGRKRNRAYILRGVFVLTMRTRVWHTPGDDRPGRATRVPATASWGEVHHLRHWAQGGSTDLANLVLICRAHHWKVHEGGWRLIRTDDGVVALPPVADDYGPERGWLRSRPADTPSTG